MSHHYEFRLSRDRLESRLHRSRVLGGERESRLLFVIKLIQNHIGNARAKLHRTL